MKHITVLLAAVSAGLLGGCPDLGALGDLLGGSNITVRLVNTNMTFSVTVRLYYHDDQNVLTEDLLKAFGEEREFTLAPGTTQSFSVDCDELQAIFIDRAELVVIGSLGPDDDTGIYRDGTDFHCGDTLVFTFSGELLPPTMEITFDTR